MSVEYPSGFDSSIHAKKPICGVLAVAIAAGVSYDVAHATMKKIAYEKGRKRFGGRTNRSWQHEALRRLAVKFTFKRIEGNMTLRKFIENHAERDKVYIAHVRGHVMILKNNCLTDQNKSRNYLLTKNMQQQILDYTRIDGKGW
jgi:hypothetical protein